MKKNGKDKKPTPRKLSAALAKLCHEFRAPLSSIIGFSNLLAKKAAVLPPEKVELYLSHILTSSNYLLNLTNGIMHLSKGEAHFETEAACRETDIKALAEESLRIVAGTLVDKELQLVADIPEKLPLLRTIPEKLQVIFINLLSNAIKNSEKGIISLKISTDDANKAICSFEVSDCGKGMEIKKLNTLLTPFSLTNGNSWEERDSLGLAITSTLCRQLGYTISAVSCPGKGSSFKILLPKEEKFQ